MFDNYKPSLPSAAVIFTVAATFVSFIVVVAKAFIGIEAGGEGWWRWDGREAEEYGSVVFASIFMILSLAGVVRLAQKAFLGPTDFQVGVLGGSMAMYANMALCCFLYFVSFGQEQQEMEGGYLLMSIVSVVFAFVYGAATAGLIFMVKKNSLGITSSDATDSRFESISSAQSSAHIDVMHDVWKFVSIFSVAGIALSFLLGFISLFTEEGERMREEGVVFNFLLTTAWTLLLAVGMRTLGDRSFGRSKATTESEVGFFFGCSVYFATLTLLLAFLFGGNPLGDGAPDGPSGSLLFAFSCFTSAMGYFVFGYLVSRYHISILHVNKDEVQSDYVVMGL